MRNLFLIALASLATAGAASAQTVSYSFSPADTAARPAASVIVDGVSYRCGEDNVCIGSGRGEDQPATRACRRLVARVGAVSAFTWRGQALSAEQIATCNASAA